ncbi:MAG TPA: selenium metabolism-associated LysR family transcriptional regulator [Peptococcaceae bacterium]|jgi:DNA-binding transcriptional LysR family regulator|nr:LysR family transcriptional regulator [Clostridia bacterium]HOB82386.1 selenium metabolism-associated LysR family transcriptional regulator [Peptococcaceae bacterium]HPZ71197.1 selenium metabolism-associated LysR family transcriptional regulator [Peptococcaceae bacterium]HQD53779.1 selenium metabolism-associated LysR family transcriptional regulator [Peptococcaceae bacterium]
MLLHQLLAFTKVAELKSFSKAAENLYLSQSTISTHISNLEAYFEQKLFDRLGKEVVLTSAGETLYPIAKEILTLQDKAHWELKKSKNKIDGELKIAASTVPAQYIAPKILAQFAQQYPWVKVNLALNDSYHVAERLGKGDADVGILGYQYLAEKLDYLPLLEEKLVLITPPSFDLPAPVSIKEIARYPLLFRKRGSGTQATLERILLDAQIDLSQLNVIGYFDNVQVIKQCVKEGLGFSVISEVAATDYVQQKWINAYELIELSEKRTFYLAFNKSRTLSPLVQEFINFCQKTTTGNRNPGSSEQSNKEGYSLMG